MASCVDCLFQPNGLPSQIAGTQIFLYGKISVLLHIECVFYFIGGEQELGCYRFSQYWGEKITEPNLTIEKCLEFCRERSVAFAALYGGHNVCRCNDVMPGESLKKDEEDCDESCKGDLENTGGCGGNYRMSLYFVMGTHPFPNQ